MSIKEEGFLSEEIKSFGDFLKEKHSVTFQICYRINTFAQKLLYELEIHNKLLEELIIGAAYKRLISGFQASIVLGGKGMTNEMKVISRFMLEQTFLIIAISKNKDIAKKFSSNDEIIRKKMINKYSKLTINPTIYNNITEVNKIIEEINSNIHRKNIKEIKTWEMAKEAGLSDHYNTYYTMLSLVVHPTARDYQDDYVVNEANEIMTIIFGPDDNDIEKVLLSNAGYILLVLEQIKYLFKITIIEDLEIIRKNYLTIWKTKFVNGENPI
jgi:hypothetical protein